MESLEARTLLAIDCPEPLDPSNSLVDDEPFLAVHPIFAPETPADYVESVHDYIANEGESSGLDAFQASTRWARTATDGSGLNWGDATTITWSIAPDGTSINGFTGEPAGASSFVSFMSGIYGSSGGGLTNQPWFSVVASVFDRWSEVSGINFVYEANDDGASFSSSSNFAPGVVGVRGDIRIGGHYIDGNSGVLAYNFFPNNGEMVIDTADSFYSNTGNNSRRLRNVMAHEVGHGLGLSHVIPVNQTKLLEPYVTTSFDGPQHDDILAVNRLYGDRYEEGSGNDSFGTAVSLGSVTTTGVSVGDNSAQQFISIDGASDTDYFRFTVGANSVLDATLSPLGFTYQQGPQNGSTSSFNSLAQNDLSLNLYNAGFSLIASAGANGLGVAESLTGVALTAGGTYYLRVAGDRDAAQLYQLDLVTSDDDPGDPDPPGDGTIDFNDYSILSYGGSQDASGTATILNGGSTLRLVGNNWKKINFSYTITPDTILAFDFSSGSQGEIHGIGLGVTNTIDDARTFRVYGTQNWGLGNYDNYIPPGTDQYVIPLGQFYTGPVSNLFFANDHDVFNPSAESIFSNVRVYESGGGPSGPDAPTAVGDLFSVNEDSSTTALNVLSNDDDGGGTLSLAGVGAGSAGGTITAGANGTVNYRPAANFFGTETFSYTVSNEAGQSSATVTVNVQPVNDLPTAVGDSFTVSAGSQANPLDVLANDTTAPDTGETLTIVGTGAGSAGGTITSNGSQLAYTPAAGFSGTETFSYTVNDGTPGSNATATVSVTVEPQAPVPDTINFNDYSIDPYSPSDDLSGPLTVEDGGTTLHIVGNRWKKIDFAYTITSNTILEFDFSSSRQGEIHAIGLDNDTSDDSYRTFRLYGTQNWGVSNYDNYSPSGIQHYIIPVGQFYTGQVGNLFFVNDHDVFNPSAESIFSNVRVYEAGSVQSTTPSAKAVQGFWHSLASHPGGPSHVMKSDGPGSEKLASVSAPTEVQSQTLPGRFQRGSLLQNLALAASDPSASHENAAHWQSAVDHLYDGLDWSV